MSFLYSLSTYVVNQFTSIAMPLAANIFSNLRARNLKSYDFITTGAGLNSFSALVEIGALIGLLGFALTSFFISTIWIFYMVQLFSTFFIFFDLIGHFNEPVVIITAGCGSYIYFNSLEAFPIFWIGTISAISAACLAYAWIAAQFLPYNCANNTRYFSLKLIVSSFILLMFFFCLNNMLCAFLFFLFSAKNYLFWKGVYTAWVLCSIITYIINISTLNINNINYALFSTTNARSPEFSTTIKIIFHILIVFTNTTAVFFSFLFFPARFVVWLIRHFYQILFSPEMHYDLWQLPIISDILSWAISTVIIPSLTGIWVSFNAEPISELTSWGLDTYYKKGWALCKNPSTSITSPAAYTYTSLPLYDAASLSNLGDLAAKMANDPEGIQYYSSDIASYATRASSAARTQLHLVHRDEIIYFSNIILPSYGQNKSSALSTTEMKIQWYRENLALLNSFGERARAARYFSFCIASDHASPFSEQENVWTAYRSLVLDSRANRVQFLSFEKSSAVRFLNKWGVHPEAYYRMLLVNISLWELDTYGSITPSGAVVLDDRRRPSLAGAADRASSAGDYVIRRHRLEQEGRARPLFRRYDEETFPISIKERLARFHDRLPVSKPVFYTFCALAYLALMWLIEYFTGGSGEDPFEGG
jgi:hypothetical protein